MSEGHRRVPPGEGPEAPKVTPAPQEKLDPRMYPPGEEPLAGWGYQPVEYEKPPGGDSSGV